MIEPRHVDLLDPTRLRILWKDGLTHDYSARLLRLSCPCAGCVEEWTGKKLLHEEAVPQDVRLVSVDLVGRYGLTFRWSDGHGTGIFAWPLLRELGGAELGSA